MSPPTLRRYAVLLSIPMTPSATSEPIGAPAWEMPSLEVVCGLVRDLRQSPSPASFAMAGEVLAATVVAPTTRAADGWATALMVLPVDEGQELIERHAELEALWVVDVDGRPQVRASSGMPDVTPAP